MKDKLYKTEEDNKYQKENRLLITSRIVSILAIIGAILSIKIIGLYSLIAIPFILLTHFFVEVICEISANLKK